jgi:hypothetical protein
VKRRCRLLKEVRDAVEFSQVRVNTCVFVCLCVCFGRKTLKASKYYFENVTLPDPGKSE